jgi:cell division protein FtsQ
VVSLYNESRELFAPQSLQVRAMVLDARGSWALRLSDGTEVVVGKNEARLRLQRFARLLPQLLAQKRQSLQRADLRYTNGFALVWAQRTGIGSGESGIGKASLPRSSEIGLLDAPEQIEVPTEREPGAVRTRPLAMRAAFPIPDSRFPIPGSPA